MFKFLDFIQTSILVYWLSYKNQKNFSALIVWKLNENVFAACLYDFSIKVKIGPKTKLFSGLCWSDLIKDIFLMFKKVQLKIQGYTTKFYSTIAVTFGNPYVYKLFHIAPINTKMPNISSDFHNSLVFKIHMLQVANLHLNFYYMQ